MQSSLSLSFTAAQKLQLQSAISERERVCYLPVWYLSITEAENLILLGYKTYIIKALWERNIKM